MKNKHVIRNILIAIVIGFILLSVRVFFGTSKAARDLKISKIDLSTIKDGTYSGEASISPVLVKLNTTIKGGKIVKIDIKEHRNGIGGKAEGPIINDVISKQSLDVDTVSGATISSKSILKAIENSLNK